MRYLVLVAVLLYSGIAKPSSYLCQWRDAAGELIEIHVSPYYAAVEGYFVELVELEVEETYGESFSFSKIIKDSANDTHKLGVSFDEVKGKAYFFDFNKATGKVEFDLYLDCQFKQ